MDTTNVKGNKGLVNVMADLVNKNYFVFLPIADTTCVDLIASNENMNLKRMQIKFRAVTNGKIELVTESVVNGKKVPVNLENIDLWAVYCPDNKQVYYVATKELIGKKSLTLRIEEPKQKQRKVNYAHAYLDIEKAWEI